MRPLRKIKLKNNPSYGEMGLGSPAPFLRKEFDMYIVYFEDGSKWRSEGHGLSDWNEMPKKKITKLEYFIKGSKVVFEGFEAYNHCPLVSYPIDNRANKRLHAVYLMGKTGEEVYQIILDFDKGKAVDKKVPWGQEYEGKPVSGWKDGIGGTPKIDINSNL